jgi:radical SAM superfamily enzyme YgiQ (UPF0313 family)
MKILLIEPAKPPSTIGGDDVFIFEPLALEYLAAGVAAEHEVKILDLRLDDGLERSLADFQPDIVGITAYTIHVNVVKRLFQQIKAWQPKVLTVVGGHHATVAPEDFMSPFIDLIVIGEGVFAFKEIVARFKKEEPFDGIPGIAFANGNGLVKTAGQTAVDLDALPFPDRSLTAKYRKQYYSEWMKPLASIRTSKGCPYRCKFCALWKVAGGRYYRREPQRVVEELAGIEEECVFFADDESLIDAARMTRLARLIEQAGIKKRYFLYGRSDTIAGNPELLRVWRDIGLERVFVGLEFFRDEDLDYIQKKSTSQDNELAVRILHDLGIDVYASFILRPEFTTTDFAALRNYCRQLELSFASFAVLTPLPGTDLYQEVSDQLITHNYDYFDFIHTLLPTVLPLEEFYAEYHELYTKGIALNKQLALLRKFPLKEIPQLLVKGRRFYSRLKTTYQDYNNRPVTP